MTTPSSDFSINARWGNLNLDRNSQGKTAGVFLPEIYLKSVARLGITANQNLVIMVLMQHKWTEANPFPSLETIAELTGFSTRNVQKVIKSMKDAGLVNVIARRNPRTGNVTSNEYDLQPLFQKLADMRDGFYKDATPTQTPVSEQKPLTPEESAFLQQAHRWIPASVMEDFLHIEPGTRDIPLGVEELAQRIKDETTEGELIAALRQKENGSILNAKDLARVVVEVKHGTKLRGLAAQARSL